MAEKLSALTPQSVRDIREAVGKVDTLPPRRLGQNPARKAKNVAAQVWVKCTSSTPSGGLYPAVWCDRQGSGAWTDHDVVNLLGANGEVPTVGTRYLCQCVGNDGSGVAIYQMSDGTAGSSGALSLLDKTGVSVDGACTSIKADVNGVLSWSNPGGHADTVVIAAATKTQWGAVTTTAQVMGDGVKTFPGGVVVGDGVSGGTLTVNDLTTGNDAVATAASWAYSDAASGGGVTWTLSIDAGPWATMRLTSASNCRFALNGAYGVTGTLGSGASVVGGIVTGLGSGGGGGTVTSVGLTMPAGFTVTGSPVTTAGTLAVSWPLTTLGDLLYEDATPQAARLAGNATATLMLLTQTGTGSVSAAPAWQSLATLASGTAPSPFPSWKKYTKTFSDFSAASGSNTITLAVANAGDVVHAVKIKHSTNFQGGAISNYTVAVGAGGSNQKYATAFDVKQAVSNTALQTSSNQADCLNQGATWNVTATATALGGLLNAATQGSVDIWLLSSNAT